MTPNQRGRGIAIRFEVCLTDYAEGGMMHYLDALCDALSSRDLPRLHHLIVGHPLAQILPSDALDEARRFLAQKAGRQAVPLVNLQFRDQTRRLLDEYQWSARHSPSTGIPSPRVEVPQPRRTLRPTAQAELPLST